MECHWRRGSGVSARGTVIMEKSLAILSSPAIGPGPLCICRCASVSFVVCIYMGSLWLDFNHVDR